MTSLAAFLAWLLGAPRWFRVSETARLLLGEIVRVLVEPETGRLRDLDETARRAVERAVQTAEASLSLAVWLLAMLHAGRPTPRDWRRARLAPCSRLPTTLELAQRTFALCARLETLDRDAHRLAHRLGCGVDEFASESLRLREPGSPLGSDRSRAARILISCNVVQASFSLSGRPILSLYARPSAADLSVACGQTGPPSGWPPPHI